MNEMIMQLGVGGIFAILVINTVFNFLKDKRMSNGNGAKVLMALKDEDRLQAMENRLSNRIDNLSREVSDLRKEMYAKD